MTGSSQSQPVTAMTTSAASTPPELSMSVDRWAASAASAGEPVASARRESVRETIRFTTIDTASTAMPTPSRCTPVPWIRWRTASKAMTTLPTRMRTPSMAAAMSSIFSWP